MAPFFLLATEGRTYFDREHKWYMETLARLACANSLVVETPFRVVDLSNNDDKEAAVAWWTARTEAGGEGMVVKPNVGLVRGPKGWVQPALKCRGREYLRIIYGVEYTEDGYLERLRSRKWGSVLWLCGNLRWASSRWSVL